MLLDQGGGLEFSGLNRLGQFRAERRQLLGGEKAARLLQDALVALGHALQETVNIRLATRETPCPARP